MPLISYLTLVANSNVGLANITFQTRFVLSLLHICIVYIQLSRIYEYLHIIGTNVSLVLHLALYSYAYLRGIIYLPIFDSKITMYCFHLLANYDSKPYINQQLEELMNTSNISNNSNFIGYDNVSIVHIYTRTIITSIYKEIGMKELRDVISRSFEFQNTPTSINGS